MSFEDNLRKYADLLVNVGLAVQPGQTVNISTEVIHKDFALLVAESAYHAKAKFVNIDLTDARLYRMRILASREEDLAYVPEYVSVKYRELVDTTAANIKIIGPENPEILSDLDPKRVNTVRYNQHMAVKYFYDEGIGKSKVHWTVAAAATPRWAKRVFPELSEAAACEALWSEIFKICRVYERDPISAWKTHAEVLQKRGRELTEMRIKTFHFKGPGTDFIVGLSPKAIFKGGGDISPRSVEFEPNIPTEEVFTTPDARVTEGKVRATRPFLVNGKLVRELEMEFKSGELVNFNAKEGKETFREYIKSDPCATRLGEVALVGIDSPVYRSGRVFEEILFDENAACHIAIGSAYKFCLEGGATMTKEQLQEIGCNESSVHTDMMISSEEVDVFANTYEGKQIQLIAKGNWII